METDPVCGMPVNRNWAEAKMEYEGRTYYFCIEDCRRQFAAEPERYAAKRR
ncbi:MAG: YHS domain-containing protein [Planctomycetes bacterium]|nr:YHS domain-containing protein [Planctomycetota bacterium]